MHRRTVAALSVTLLTAGMASAVLTAPASASPTPAPTPVPTPRTQTRPAHPSALHGRDLAAHPGPAATAAAVPHGKVDPAVRQQRPVRGGQIRVTVSGDASEVARAAREVGGRVVVAHDGVSSVLVAPSKVSALAASPAVRTIAEPEHPITTGTAPSEGVAASGAAAWQSPGGITGTGVKVAVVDSGFGVNQSQYDSEVSLGHLGASPTVLDVNNGCATSPSGSVYGDAHGLATAEIVHQQAPDAQLFLYCVYDATDMSSIVSDIAAKGITIVSSSLGWPGDARGDGTGAGGSVSAAVRTARQHGILWIESAGNSVDQHYGGTAVDRNHDGYLDFGNANPKAFPYESNFFVMGPGSYSNPAYADFYFQWDQWATSSAGARLEAYGVQCTRDYNKNDTSLDGCGGYFLNPITVSHTKGSKPVVRLSTESLANTSQFEQIWQVQVFVNSSFPLGVRFDLTGYGPFDGNSALSCSAYDDYGYCTTYPASATVNSINAPADSPYVMAVGAVDVGADGRTQGTLEYFSSRGPTIDGRVKPDIAAWDGVSTYVTQEQSSGFFYGTSASAPHVAGAAALVKDQHSDWDAAQIQTFLEQRASSGKPKNPPTNDVGHGKLTLGSTTTALPTPTGYVPTTPVRLLDTRKAGPALGPKGVRSVDVSGAVPASATAVAVNLTGIGARTGTNLAVYPGPSYPGTSNLNLDATDSTAAVFAIVTIAADRTIRVRNAAGTVNVAVDLLGYFAAPADAPTAVEYSALPPSRVGDTRLTHGGGGPIGAGGHITVETGRAGDASAMVNITAVKGAASGDLRVSATCDAVPNTSTLNYSTRTRANLAVAALAVDGTFCITSLGGPADVLVDLVGAFGSSGTAGYVALPSPVRIADSRRGEGFPVGTLGATTRTLWSGGIFGTPYTTSALLLGVTGTAPSTTTDLEVFPGSTRPSPPTSTLNLVRGETVPNAAAGGLSSHLVGVYNAAGGTHVIVDLFGYFL